MADLNFEDNLIAACLQDPEVFKRARRAQIRHTFFHGNDFHEFVFKTAEHLHKIGNDFNQSAFEDLIMASDDLDTKQKGAFSSRIHTMFRCEPENVALTIDILKNKRVEKELLRLLSGAAQSVQKRVAPEDILDQVRRGVTLLGSNDPVYELFDFFGTYEDRKHARLNVAAGAKDRFKMALNFSGFAHYFPYGIPAGTTFSASGPTYSGKSVVLSNIAYIASHPVNGLDVVYVVAENTVALSGNRLDAIFLDKDQNLLMDKEYVAERSEEDDEFFKMANKKGWGRVVLAKVPSNGFDGNTVRAIMDDVLDQGYKPKVLIIDSPDHQKSIDKYEQTWMGKGRVYYDNKAIAEEYEVSLFVSAPMKGGAYKKTTPDNEDVAGSQDIARVVDFQIMFNVNEEDKLLGRARLVVTKNREYNVIDGKCVDFRFKRSLLLIPFEESFSEGKTQWVQPVEDLVEEEEIEEIVDQETGEVTEVVKPMSRAAKAGFKRQRG